jgi:hypothetical protein
MKRPLAMLGVLAIAVAVLVWWFQPAQALKRRTKALMETLTLLDGAGAASRKMKIRPMSEAVADEVEIRGAGDDRADGVFTRSEIEAGFAWLAGSAKSTRFRILDFEAVTIEGDTGVVTADVDATVVLDENRPLDGPHRVTLVWRHDGNSWRLTRAEWQPE